MNTKYNYSLLKGKIIEKYGTYGTFSNKICISATTISKKLLSKTDWRQEEIARACRLLDIDFVEIPKYFFCVEY